MATNIKSYNFFKTLNNNKLANISYKQRWKYESQYEYLFFVNEERYPRKILSDLNPFGHNNLLVKIKEFVLCGKLAPLTSE